MRWGLDAAARRPFSMDKFANNTWRSGLDRVLLGVVMSGDEHRHLGRGLPLDDVGSNEIDLAGRLAELVDRLSRCLAGLDAATTVDSWMVGPARRRPRPRRGGRRRRLAAAPARARAGSRGLLVHRRRAGAAAPRRPRPAAEPARRPTDPRQLPHRHAHRLHDDADALGPAPRRVPGRPRRRRVPAPRHRRRRRRAAPPARSPASATPAARTASSSSTRCSPRPSTSSSPTPAPTSTPAPDARPPSRSASCWTPPTGRRRHPCARRS